jgi:hypothetical protein
MNEDVADGLVVDLGGVDMASLLTDAAGAEMKTALDRLLISSASGNNGFNNSIDLSDKPLGIPSTLDGSRYAADCR